MMRRMLTLAAAAVVATSVLIGASVAAGAQDDSLTTSKYFNRLFIVTCAYSHTSSDDPIAKPGQPGASHSHDFFGNTTTDAYSTLDSLQHGGTTCNRAEDTAGYWMPTVSEDGVPVRPGVATFYYRAPGSNPNAVTAFPPGFQMIAGDMEAMDPQSLKVVEWACRVEGAKKPWRPDIPHCDAGSTLAFRANFPDCWNGTELDSADHRSHVAYSGKNGTCPPGFPVPVPEIAMTATYPGTHGGSLTLSTRSPYGGHADFFNAWQPGALDNLVDGCLRDERNCGDFAGPGHAGPLAPMHSQGSDLPVGVSTVSELTTPATDATTYAQHAVLTGDGSVVAYEQHRDGRSDIVVRDVAGGPAQVVSSGLSAAPANGNSYSPTISNDGRYVAFVSDAHNLVPGDTNAVRDVFVHDRDTGTTARVTGVAGQPDGSSDEPRLSGDGRYLVFTSVADNLVAEDTNRHPDVFRATLGSHAVTVVSVAADGGMADQSSSQPDISADGRFVAFSSWAARR